MYFLLSVAYIVVFVVKYKASPTGVLGAIGSAGHAAMSVAYTVVPMLLPQGAGAPGIEVVFGLMNGANWVATALVLMAVVLAPVPRRREATPIAPPWPPPPTPRE
jgi:hypothetical protein